METIDLDKSDRSNLYSQDADNVRAVEMSVSDVREFIEDTDDHDLMFTLDELQGEVKQGNMRRAYLVIKVTP